MTGLGYIGHYRGGGIGSRDPDTTVPVGHRTGVEGDRVRGVQEPDVRAGPGQAVHEQGTP